MLLVFHFDKNDSEIEEFLCQEIRMDLGFFPKKGTRLRLRSIGFNNNTRGGNLFVKFPDLASGYLEEEIIDTGLVQTLDGFMFSALQGGFMNDTKNTATEDGFGAYNSSSDTRDLDLDLGEMDTQKDFFRIVVSGRLASKISSGFNNLNNFSAILEMVHFGAAT